MKIDNFDTNKEVFIVAEIGNNHEGSFTLAEELIGYAKNAGAHAVKFQTFKTENFINPKEENRFKQLKKFELSYTQFEKLALLAKKLGILFLATPFDLESALFLNDLVPAFKVASGDNNFYPLLQCIAKTGKPILLSSGITNLSELNIIQKNIYKYWSDNPIKGELAILHCVSAYPVPFNEANLNSIPYLKEKLNCTIGYSDHTLGIDACIIAVALGARILEKHFTLDKNHSSFRDHSLSADPQDLKVLVEKVALTCELLGKTEKKIQECEKNGIAHMRRSIIAKKDLKKDHKLKLEDINWVRPSGGLKPGEEELILNRILCHNITGGSPLSPKDFKEQ